MAITGLRMISAHLSLALCAKGRHHRAAIRPVGLWRLASEVFKLDACQRLQASKLRPHLVDEESHEVRAGHAGESLPRHVLVGDLVQPLAAHAHDPYQAEPFQSLAEPESHAFPAAHQNIAQSEGLPAEAAGHGLGPVPELLLGEGKTHIPWHVLSFNLGDMRPMRHPVS